MTISLIAAMARNRVIGQGNALPWNIPGDMKFFKRKTAGHPVIMGRKTYDSMGMPLPGRTNIVISRSGGGAPGSVWVRTVEESLKAATGAPGSDEVFVIGG